MGVPQKPSSHWFPHSIWPSPWMILGFSHFKMHIFKWWFSRTEALVCPPFPWSHPVFMVVLPTGGNLLLLPGKALTDPKANGLGCQGLWGAESVLVIPVTKKKQVMRPTSGRNLWSCGKQNECALPMFWESTGPSPRDSPDGKELKQVEAAQNPRIHWSSWGKK